MQSTFTYRWTIATVLFLALMSGVFTFDSLPPLSASLRLDILMTNTEFGTTMSFFHLASPIFTPIGGVLADRYGVKRVLTISAIILAIAGASRIFADSVVSLSALMFLSGVGFASFGPCVAKALGSVFPQKQLARASGIVYTSIGIGNMIAFGTAATVFAPMLGGWRPVLILIGVYTFIVGILWFFIFKEDHKETNQEGSETIKDAFSGIFNIARSNKDMWALSIYYALPIFAYFGILSHVGPLLGERGIDNPGFYFAILTGASVFSNLAGGVISDYLGRRRIVLMACAIGLAASLPFLVTLPAGAGLMISALMAGLFFGPVIPICIIIPVELKDIGPAKTGAAVGFMFMIGNIGAIFGPILIGLLLDITKSPAYAVALPVFLLLLSIIPLLTLTETGCKQSN